MDTVLIALGVTVVILMYVLYLYVYASSTTIAAQANLNSDVPAVAVTSQPNATRFAVGVWIYVNTWATGTKNIVSMTGNSTTNRPLFNLYLDNSAPVLKLDLDVGSGNQTMTFTNNFPLQRWTYVTFSVDNGYTDLYLDGKLVKSVQLQGLLNAPPNTGVSMYIGRNSHHDTMISQLFRWSTAISPQDVWSQYLRGNGQSWGSTSYGMNVGILQNNQQTAAFRII